MKAVIAALVMSLLLFPLSDSLFPSFGLSLGKKESRSCKPAWNPWAEDARPYGSAAAVLR